MKYFCLDNTIEASQFCFGCEALGGTDWGDDIDIKEIEQSIEIALDKGINFFDTADIYGLGLSEIRLAKILAHRRHDLILATKGGVSWKKYGNNRAITKIDNTPKYIRSAIENSLKRLRVDHIPVYYIHWPEKGKDIAHTAAMLYELKKEGKIGAIGCSNFTSIQLSRALEFAPIKLLQIPVNILDSPPDERILEVCWKNKIHIVGYNILASGLLTGKFNNQSLFTSSDRRSRLPQFTGNGLKESIKKVNLLKKKAEDSNVSLAQYSIHKALCSLSIDATIIGIKKTSQLFENIKAFK